MSTPESTSSTDIKAAAAEISVEREIRFAVVMYGGVSLAIYINGVTQELLHMVRATARASTPATMFLSPDQLTASEKVYRKIAELLDKEAGVGQASDNVTRTRFIVDVISGTSAGGINGVFLAKALARNQSMEGLKKLWLTEGDFGKLLNDAKAEDYAPELGFAVQKPEKSLLNSQRMYRKLLEALKQMGQSRKALETSPLVSELDLFVTTTDIEGIPLPIQLADGVIYERRFKNVFHFRYATEEAAGTNRDDFGEENDPFLAFAARCTSSFPFAFDAMQLGDIRAVLSRYPEYRMYDPKSGSQWDHFLKNYLRLGLIDIDKLSRASNESLGLGGRTVDQARSELRKAFRSRSFGDGGYLDNKPFSYATSMLMRRQGGFDVTRKLLYVEPTPEHPELAPAEPESRPDFAQNVRAATLELPRQETIREDIARVDERNQMIQRLNTFAREVDGDVVVAPPPELMSHAEFCKAGLDDMMKRYGISYGGYHRLKVGEITTFLAEIVTRVKGHDPSSEAGDAIRELVSAWRRDKYRAVLSTPERRKPLGKKTRAGPVKTENRFLVDFDIRYRLRRVIFLARRIREFLELESESNDEFHVRLKRLAVASLDHVKKDSALDQKILARVRRWLNSSTPVKPTAALKEWLSSFRDELQFIRKCALNDALRQARTTEEDLLNLAESVPARKDSARAVDYENGLKRLRELLLKIDLPWAELAGIIECKGAARLIKAEEIYRQHDLEFEKIAVVLNRLLRIRRARLKTALSELKKTRPITLPAGKNPRFKPYMEQGSLAARLCFREFDKKFVVYDMVIHPVEYGTGAGEANTIEIHRVSPEDSPSLMRESAGQPREKLAGRALMSFGAFLDERWRKNDMLWGRLDGAERLICILLGKDTKDESVARFVRDAHIAILREEILQGNGEAVCRLLSNALARSDESSTKHLQKVVDELLNTADLAAYLDGRRDYLVNPQKFDRRLDPEVALRYISRSTTITGNMLEGLAEGYESKPGKRAAAWVTRLGTTFWSMIAVSVPQTLGNIFFHHWLGLLYLFSAVIILAGIAFHSVSALGWQLLGATVSLHIVAWLLGDFIAGGRHWLRAARRIGIAVVAILIGSGAYFVLDRSLKFFSDQDRASIIGVIAGFLVLVLLGFVEWRRWLKNFLRSPTTIFSYRLLGGLTIATAVLIGTLIVIGPVNMVGFEFSRAAKIADPFKAHVGVDRLRIQLGVDFALIVAYTTMLASYCVAGAKLFWQRRENLVYRFQQDRQAAGTQAGTPSNPATTDAEHSFRLKLFYALLVVGFAFAGLQWLAAIADGSENIGLLLYLKNTPPPNFNGLELAYWSATVKFWLIAAGAIYAVIAFSFGAWEKLGERLTTLKPVEVRLRIMFVAVSLVYFALSVYALFVCRPNPRQCSPELLYETWARFCN